MIAREYPITRGLNVSFLKAISIPTWNLIFTFSCCVLCVNEFTHKSEDSFPKKEMHLFSVLGGYYLVVWPGWTLWWLGCLGYESNNWFFVYIMRRTVSL